MQVGALEAIKVKILVRTEGDSLKSIKVSQGGRGLMRVGLDGWER